MYICEAVGMLGVQVLQAQREGMLQAMQRRRALCDRGFQIIAVAIGQIVGQMNGTMLQRNDAAPFDRCSVRQPRMQSQIIDELQDSGIGA